MTKEQLVSKLDAWWANWASTSNATSDQEERIDIGETAIADFKEILLEAGGHPLPPPPRIRA